MPAWSASSPTGTRRARSSTSRVVAAAVPNPFRAGAPLPPRLGDLPADGRGGHPVDRVPGGWPHPPRPVPRPRRLVDRPVAGDRVGPAAPRALVGRRADLSPGEAARGAARRGAGSPDDRGGDLARRALGLRRGAV